MHQPALPRTSPPGNSRILDEQLGRTLAFNSVIGQIGKMRVTEAMALGGGPGTRIRHIGPSAEFCCFCEISRILTEVREGK